MCIQNAAAAGSGVTVTLASASTIVGPTSVAPGGLVCATSDTAVNSAWNVSGPPVTVLTNTHIFVGNSSNRPADVALSGDATLANTGAMTFATVNSSPAALPIGVTVNGKGLVTASSDVTGTNGHKIPFLDGQNQFSAGQACTPHALTDGATITPDFSTSCNFTVTIAGNRTIAAPLNLQAGTCGFIAVTQGSGGSHTLTWNAAWHFAGGTAPTLSTGAGQSDLVTFCSPSATVLASQLSIANY